MIKIPKNSNWCIHEAFERAAQKFHDHVAVSCNGATITYSELNGKANQLANYLRSIGVGPEILVGLCCERSIDLVIGVLGILKAGGGYVPLDNSYPTERLNWLLEDSAVKTIVVDAQGESLLKDFDGLLLNLNNHQISEHSKQNPPQSFEANNTCYVIYTSGSTGKPKGVVVEHDSVVKLFESTQDLYNYSDHDVWTLFHSIGFDFSVWEIWGALFYGGKAVVVPMEVVKTPASFYDLMVSEAVTILNQTPSAFRQLTSYLEFSEGKVELIPLRLVIFGGESLNPRNLASWLKYYDEKAPQFVNMYGITETTVFTTYQFLSESDIYSGTGSPIGIGIPNWEVYLMDEEGKIAPPGVVGEIYVGGPGVTRCYLNQPLVTAQKFSVDPFGLGDKKRFYKSGDYAIQEQDGSLSYVGRQDKQVKIRGYRIELGEIENTLLTCDGVIDVAVTTYDFTETEKRIVAYYISNVENTSNEIQLFSEKLIAFASQNLPPQMRPSTFIAISSIPTTSHGKLDYSKLPSPATRPSVKSIWAAPTCEDGIKLTAIWGKLLGITGVGTNDNFFDLGGSSLSAFQMIAAVQNDFDVKLDLSLVTRGDVTIDQILDTLKESRG